MFKIDPMLSFQPRVIGKLDSLVVASHESQWKSLFASHGRAKEHGRRKVRKNSISKAVNSNILDNKLTLTEGVDYSDLVADYASLMHSKESENYLEPGVIDLEEFALQNTEALTALAEKILSRAESTTQGFKSAKPLQKLVFCAKLASFIADEAHEYIQNAFVHGSLHNTLACSLAAVLPIRTFSDEEITKLGVVATGTRQELREKIASDESTDAQSLFKLNALVNAINVHSARAVVLRSAKKMSDSRIECEEEDWQALADLYQEAIKEHQGREPIEFSINLDPEVTGLRDSITIVFHCNDPEMTQFPVSGAIAFSNDLNKFESDFSTLSKNGVAVDKLGFKKYKPQRVVDVLNIPFYLHPRGEFSCECLSNNTPEATKRILGANYEMIRAQILYALGLETIAHYKVQSPNDVAGPVGVETDEDGPLVLPHKDREILLEPSKEESDIDAAFDAAEEQLGQTKGRAHRRLLKHGKPSRRAYEFSQEVKENPVKIKMQACVVNLKTKTHEWLELPNDAWESFSTEIENLDDLYRNSDEHEIRFHTFVRRPEGVEAHSRDVKEAVVGATGDSPEAMLA